MSNSAFTPTQIEVTNEVPVNVPVVTGWEQYVPTVTGVTTSFAWGFYKRSGSSILIQGGFNFSATATSQIIYNLPSGISIDTTKLISSNSNDQANRFGNGAVVISGTDRRPVTAFRALLTNSISFTSDTSTGGTILGNGYGSSGNQLTFSAEIPVAEWAGSGTTTLATRAVEEYAWSTDATTTAGNTQTDNGLYGNGPAGSRFYSFDSTTASSRTTKRVRFQIPILSTDTVIFEYSENAGLSWYSSSNGFISVSFAGSSIYGVNIVPVSGSTTDYYVQFGNKGYLQSNATYGGNGNPWSIIAGNANYLWRLRKVSGGAQVGYPVSARNIVGDTSGSVVPVGMLGELKEASNAAVTATYSVTTGTVATLSLGAGTWLVMNNISGYHSVRPSSGIGATTLQITANGVEVARADSIALYYSSAVAESVPDWYCSMQTVITVPSGSTYSVVSVLNAVQNSGTPSNFATTTRAADKMRAVRIA